MDTIFTFIRQTFMPNREYHRLREEEKAWNKLRKPVYTTMFCILILAIIIPTFISLTIALWPEDSPSRPFCDEWGSSMMTAILNETFEGHDLFEDDMINLHDIRDQEAIAYYFDKVFLPSFGFFLVSTPFLFAGMAVAYSAPQTNMFLRVFELIYNCVNSTSRIGGVPILIILNMVFAIAFTILAILQGPKVMRPGSPCSLPLFWCYEITAWGLAILFGGTSIVLKKRSVGMPTTFVQDHELEMTEPVERFINERLENVEDMVSGILDPCIQPQSSIHTS